MVLALKRGECIGHSVVELSQERAVKVGVLRCW
jgi:hypothetical protein